MSLVGVVLVRSRSVGGRPWELKCIVNASASLPTATEEDEEPLEAVHHSSSADDDNTSSSTIYLSNHPLTHSSTFWYNGQDETRRRRRRRIILLSLVGSPNRHNWDSAHDPAINLIVMLLIINKSLYGHSLPPPRLLWEDGWCSFCHYRMIYSGVSNDAINIFYMYASEEEEGWDEMRWPTAEDNVWSYNNIKEQFQFDEWYDEIWWTAEQRRRNDKIMFCPN